MGNSREVQDDDEYAKLIKRMNPPRVVIDNDACDNSTVIWVDSVNKHGVLLEVVQFLTDLNLFIKKAYISSDGNWFMNVFNVTDCDGNKLRDKEILDHIKTSLESDSCLCVSSSSRSSSSGVSSSSKDYTSIELCGADRTGLLSEICAVLRDLDCNIVKAELWTHNAQAAAVVHITDKFSSCAIEDPARLSSIKQLLRNVLKGDLDSSKEAKLMLVSTGATHTERRLHQLLMHLDDLCEQKGPRKEQKEEYGCRTPRPRVAVTNCADRDYTVVTLRCQDRMKLLFDTLCALTDLHYDVFHGTVEAGQQEAYQEYYIRHTDGRPVRSETERNRIVECLKSAIERRASKGLELELQTEDRVGLLSDVTRTFRENGLCIRRAEISTAGGRAVDTFHVLEMSGNFADAKTIDSVRRQIGQGSLRVKEKGPAACPNFNSPNWAVSAVDFFLSNLLRLCSFQSL